MDRPFRSQTFRIEPYDSAVSLYLKSNLISRDLMIEAVKELLGKPAESVVTEDRAANHAKAEGKSLGELMREASGSTFRPARERPAWKLLIRTVFFAPYVLLRNWMRRLRGGFPVVVLYHHVIADRPSHIGMSTEWFLKHANFLKRHYRIVSLSESLRLLRSGKVTAPTAVLTFDDGYRDNFINLRAVTERLDLPAMLFVSTEHISTGRLFQHDVIRNQLDFLPLTWDQIRFLHKSGFEIGGHTRIHFDCGSTDAKALEHEIVGCKTDLEMELKEPARFFSFPWGNRKNMSEVAVQIATGAFEHVFSAYGGANFPHAGKDFGEILRPAHANSLWELELTMQSILEF
jgi:peptidoglycan/xylan/chitin deacetylase (PgdA/CDA1 family)